MGVSTLYRPEFLADITLNTTNSPYNLPTDGGKIPNDRFLYGLRLEFSGRMTNPATGNPTGTLADAPYSLIDYIKVSGYHRHRGNFDEFVNVRAADLRARQKIYNARAPFVTPSSLSVSASATNDIRFIIDVPFTPQNLSAKQQLFWLLDAPNYDQLKLEVRFSDDKSVFSGQTTAPTFSAYGGSTGNPKLTVSGIFAMAGRSRFSGFVPGRMYLWVPTELTSGDITGGANNSRMFNIPRGYLIRSILLKTGVKATTVSGGNNAYSTLSNTILTNVKVFQGANKLIRWWPTIFGLQEEAGVKYGGSTDTGYGLIDFAMNGDYTESLNTVASVAGATGDVDTFVQADIAGASNQGALALYEELRYAPSLVRRNRSSVSMAGARR